MVLLAIHERFWSFRFHCILSALLCGSNMCTQVSSSVSKLEIPRLLQPLFVFKSSRAHLRRCVFCSLVSKWGTHLAQTFLRSKRVFRIVCTLPSDMPVQLAISLTDNRASYSTTIFTAAMLALVTEVLGLPGRVSSSTRNCLALKALTHLKTVRIEMVWGPYIPLNSLNICFESILSLMRHLYSYEFQSSGPCSNVTSKLVSVYDCVYMTASISVWHNSVSWKAICTK